MWKNPLDGRVSSGAGDGKAAPAQGALEACMEKCKEAIDFLVSAADTRNSGKQPFGCVWVCFQLSISSKY